MMKMVGISVREEGYDTVRSFRSVSDVWNGGWASGDARLRSLEGQVNWKPEGWVPKRKGFYFFDHPEWDGITVVELWRGKAGSPLYAWILGNEVEESVDHLRGRWAGPITPPREARAKEEKADPAAVQAIIALQDKLVEFLSLSINSYGRGRLFKEVKNLMADGLTLSNVAEVIDYYENQHARKMGWGTIRLKVASMANLAKALTAYKQHMSTPPWEQAPTVKEWRED